MEADDADGAAALRHADFPDPERRQGRYQISNREQQPV